MSGKGDGRRNENTALVEANWPTNWNTREQEAAQTQDKDAHDAPQPE